MRFCLQVFGVRWLLASMSRVLVEWEGATGAWRGALPILACLRLRLYQGWQLLMSEHVYHLPVVFFGSYHKSNWLA